VPPPRLVAVAVALVGREGEELRRDRVESRGSRVGVVGVAWVMGIVEVEGVVGVVRVRVVG
jgi:hypothetical protein